MFSVLAIAAGCSGPGTDADTGADPRIVEGAPHACPDPSARSVAPFDRIVVGDDWPPDGSQTLAGRGVSIDDLDGDGHLDLFVPRTIGPSRFLFGDGRGGFVDRSEAAHPTGIADAFGASSADFDADGDADLFVYRANSPAVVLRNAGDGTFVGEAHPEWDPDTLGCGGSGTWGDLDLDGDLDLFYGRLGRYDEPVYRSCVSTLLLNDGTGAMTDDSDRIPPYIHDVRVMASGFFEVDGDPWPELHVVVDLPQVLEGDRLLDNDGTSLVELSGTGLEVDIAGMGLAAGDVNDDGVTDFAVPGIDHIAVLTSSTQAAGRWVDQSLNWGIVPDASVGQSVGWGGEFVDLDADGWLDLPMGYGTIPYAPQNAQPDEIYRNLGDGAGFERVGARWGFDDPFATRGFAVADLNEDGWPDIAKRDVGGVVAVYLSRCGDAHTLTVSLDDPSGANPDAIGATVEVEIAGRTLSRTITAGSTSYASSGPPAALFGLGSADHVDAIRVRWPTGERTTHPGVAADQQIAITYAPDP